MRQDICHINGNVERKLCTVSEYIEELLSIVETENKKYHRCSKLKTLVELVTYKLIMSLDGIHTSILPRQVDHPRCTILANDTVVLDVIFQKYFQESLLEDIICENCSSGSSESIISTFNVSRYLKGPPSVLESLFQRGTYDMTTFEAIQNDLKVAIPLELLYK